MTQISHLPVVNEKFEVVGLLSKQKISMEMADISLAATEFEKIPKELYDYEISESLLYYFQSYSQIPVINEQSQKVDSWDKPRFLAEISRLQKFQKEAPKKEKPKEEFTENKTVIFSFMSQILSNFPDALFSTDKEGITTFYNESFENEILTLPQFKDSIPIAEKYFKELSQDLIGAYLKNHDIKMNTSKKTFPVVQAFIKNLGFMIRVITLIENEIVKGFLFHFIDPKLFIQKMNTKGYSFPNLDEAFTMKIPLEGLIADIESRYIFYCLKENEDNISHTADALKIPRSTLQNKIKLLKVFEKFSEKTKAPVPRKIKKSVEKKAKPANKVSVVKLKTSKKPSQKKITNKSQKLIKNPKRKINLRGSKKPKK